MVKPLLCVLRHHYRSNLGSCLFIYLALVCPFQNIHFMGGQQRHHLIQCRIPGASPRALHKAGVQKNISRLAGWLDENE